MKITYKTCKKYRKVSETFDKRFKKTSKQPSVILDSNGVSSREQTAGWLLQSKIVVIEGRCAKTCFQAQSLLKHGDLRKQIIADQDKFAETPQAERIQYSPQKKR